MTRQRSEVTDRWHKAALRPGEHPCTAHDTGTAPTPAHGKGDRWAATWDETRDGQRKQRSRQFRYREQAVSFQRKMRDGLREGQIPPALRLRGGVVTVAGFFPRFMALTARDRSASSHGKIRSQFTRMIEPVLGGWDLADLQYEPGVIRDWQAALRTDEAGPYAASTVAEAFALLSRMFGCALGERDTRVTVNPCQHPQARPGKADRKRGARPAEWTAPKIAAAYLAPMPDGAPRGSMPAWGRYRAAVLVAATTGGMRLGEVMALAPEDIDWDRQTVTMRYSLARDFNGANHFRDGKTDAARRVMTASPLALAALREHMAAFRPVTITLPLETMDMYGRPVEAWPVITRQLIFSTGAGGLVSDPAYQSACRYGLNAAGLLPAREIESRATRDAGTGRYVPAGGSQRPHLVGERYDRPSDHGLHFHALRHFYVSLLHDQGMPDAIIQAEVGHEQLSTVRGTGLPDGVTAGYMHPVTDLREGWRKRIRAIVGEAFGPLLPGLAGAEHTA
jgi:integrase